ncbi:MAG: hypothetical protein MUF15_15640, partial [Acidobacteria bacterium]|nr:hypothetical protein [Acidobacteriota bacterium]
MNNFVNDFMAKLKYEVKLVLSMRNLFPILLILTVALGFIQYGVSTYKYSQEQKASFQTFETQIVDIYATYRHYATYGFRVMLLPAPESIFFTNSTVLQDMTGNIFPGHRLHIYKSLKGRNTFDINKYSFADFSGILFFLGSLMALLYGYTAFFNIEYQRFLTSFTNELRMFFSTILARAIILAIIILFFITAAILLIVINGIPIGIDWPMVLYFNKIYGVSIFFLVLGSLFRTFEFQIMGFIGAVSSWFSFLFIIPFLVCIIVAAKSDFIKPENQLEIEKLKLVMDFEKKAKENKVTLEINKNPENIHREYVRSYYKNEFSKIQALDEEMRVQMHELTKLYYKLSSFFPTTDYLAAINEISSKGYKALDASYRHLIQIKADFFKEYMEKVYFSSQPVKVEPFLKGDDNVFKSKPELPDYFHLGNFFNLLWIVALSMFSFYRYKNNLFELPGKEKNVPEPQDIKIKRGKLKSWHIFSDLLKLQLFNLLSNATREFKKKGYSFRVFLDDQELNTAKKRQKFLYLCHPKTMPGHLVLGNFLTLVMDLTRTTKVKRKEIISRFSLETAWKKKFSQLKISELGYAFLAILELKQFDIYLIDDIGKNMLLNYCCDLADKVNALQEAGSTVLFLTTDVSYVKKENVKGTFFESPHWVDTIIGIKDSIHLANA